MPTRILTLLAALALALTSACTAQPSGAPPSTEAPPSTAAAASPAAALPPAAEVARYAESLLADYPADGPGAAVLVKRGDEVLYRGARGMASIELGVPLSPDHVFRIGSVSKQFGAVAILKLAEDGKLSLDDPLSRFLPDYPGGERITVLQLLNHTAGVRSYTGLPGMMEKTIRYDVDTAGLIDEFRDEPADFAPGEGWSYSNSGYVLVGAVIEKASGQSWHAYLKQAFLDPLGMRQTGYGNSAEGVIPGHATGYDHKDGRTVSSALISMTQPHVAGALVSSVDDLARWNAALHQGRVLEPDSYRRMITPEGAAREKHYGLGISNTQLNGHRIIAHGGGIHGFLTYNAYLPETATSVVVLHNASSDAEGVPTPGQIGNRLAAFAAGSPFPPAKAVALPAEALGAYEGTFRAGDEAWTFKRAGDRLTVQEAGDGRPMPLVPVGDGAFVPVNGLDRYEFTQAGDGPATQLRYVPETGEPPVTAARE